MGSYKALVLDFDGTLAATLDDVTWCMTRTLENFGLPAPSPSDVQATMGLPLEEALRLLSKDACKVAESEWVRAYREIYLTDGGHRASLFPGAAELLSHAREHRITILVASNKGTAALRALLERLKIVSFVNVILGGDSVAYPKPDPRLYRAEISPRLAGVRDSEVLVVGDTETDLRFASAAGLDCCWAAYGYGNRARCLDLKPTHVISSMSELAPLLA